MKGNPFIHVHLVLSLEYSVRIPLLPCAIWCFMYIIVLRVVWSRDLGALSGLRGSAAGTTEDNRIFFMVGTLHPRA